VRLPPKEECDAPGEGGLRALNAMSSYKVGGDDEGHVAREKDKRFAALFGARSSQRSLPMTSRHGTGEF